MYKYIDNNTELKRFIEHAKNSQFVGFDTENAGGLDPLSDAVLLLLMQFEVDRMAYVVNVQRTDVQLLRPVLENPKITKIIQNAKHDYKLVKAKTGIEIDGIYDTMITEFLLNAGYSDVEFNLRALAQKYAGVDISKEARESFFNHFSDEFSEEQIEYAARDVLVLNPIRKRQQLHLNTLGLNAIAELEFKLLPVVGDMELKGIRLDVDKWRTSLDETKNKLFRVRNELLQMLPEPPAPPPKPIRYKKDGTPYKNNAKPKPKPVLNLNSWQQVANAFNECGIDLEVCNKVTNKGLTNSSTLKFALKKYSEDSTKKEIISKFLQFRELAQVEKTFGDNLLEHVREDGRIHAEFNQIGTDSGRFSCVPTDSEILTSDGWKAYNEVSIGDVVVGYDLNTKKLEWTSIVDITIGKDIVGNFSWRNGRGHETYGKGSSFVRCTPNHKWVASSNGVFGFIESSKLKEHRKIPAEFTLFSSGVEGLYHNPHEAALIGWAITDGHVLKLARGYALEIQVVKDTSVKALNELLKNFKHNESVYKGKEYLGHDKHYRYRHRFYVGIDIFTRIWSNVLKLGLQKYIFSLDEVSRVSMFDAMMEADGSPRKNGLPFGAQKPDVVDAFCTLSAVLGNRVRFTERESGFTDFSSCSSGRTEKSVRYKAGKDEVDIWCPTTTLGTWVMRQNGNVVITGNSSKPNLQNIKKRGEDGKLLRSCFVPAPGYKFVLADYSQIELRIAAEMSQDPLMIKLLNDPKGDIHKSTASQMYMIASEEITKELRSAAKTLNFGLIYGMAVDTLSDTLGCSKDEAAEHLQKYSDTYGVLMNWINKAGVRAVDRGFAKTIGGRFRWFPNFGNDKRLKSFYTRVGKNHPVQGCLPRDTRILTPDGWLPIGEFQGGLVWTGEKWANATKVNRGYAKRLRLHLNDGRTFDCDDRHYLLVNDAVYPRWENMENIVGKPLVRDVGSDWGQSIGDVEDWYWLGRMIGDGYLSSYGWGCAFGSAEKLEWERFIRWLNTKDIKGLTNSSKGYSIGFDCKGNAKVYGYTKKGKELWQSLGMVVGKGARDKRIPAIAFTLDKERRQAILDGYLDADGYKRSRSSKFTSVNRKLLEDTLRLLQTVGVSGRISSGMTNNTGAIWYELNVHKSIHTLRVDSIEELWDEEMFTLSVDDERHSFSSEGIISKNTSADMTKTAMVLLHKPLKKYGATIVNTIHDEICIEVPEKHAVEVARLLKRKMIAAGKNYLKSVPVMVDVKIRDCWWRDDGIDDDENGQQYELI